MYATQAQMESLFGLDKLLLMAEAADLAASDKFAAALQAADDEVNGYLQGVVPLPLSQVPRAIRLHACNIAYYYLDVDNPTEGATARYKQAIRYLEGVQSGRLGLGLDSQDEPVAKEEGVRVSAPERTFTTDGLRGYTG